MDNRRKIRDTVVFDDVTDFGKVPPQAIDLEESVLGAILLEKDCIHIVAEILKADDFYKETNKLIFESVLSLFQTGKTIDLLTVVNELKSKGNLEAVGGAYYITQLTSRVASASNVEFHSRIVSQKSIQRGLIKISSQTIKKAFEDSEDVFDIIDEHNRDLTNLTDKLIVDSTIDMKTLHTQALEQNKKLISNKGLIGVPSGFIELDALTGGWQNSDLIILAARPGMGKTSFVLSLLKHPAIKQRKSTAIFSLEMSAKQLFARMQSQESGLELHKIIKTGLDETELNVLNLTTSGLVNSPLTIDDTSALSLLQFRLKAQKLKREKKVELIIIDYLQLMKGTKGQNRDGEIGEITRGLKSVAKDLDIPIIVLSQLSRAVETRGASKRPQLSDLRESGSIEQDADMVMFIYRPEYYGIMTDEDNMPTQGIAQIIIAKHRNGGLAEIPLRWIGYLTKFENLNENTETEQMNNTAMVPNNEFDDNPF
jgi:replicative DNA helicase